MSWISWAQGVRKRDGQLHPQSDSFLRRMPERGIQIGTISSRNELCPGKRIETQTWKYIYWKLTIIFNYNSSRTWKYSNRTVIFNYDIPWKIWKSECSLLWKQHHTHVSGTRAIVCTSTSTSVCATAQKSRTSGVSKQQHSSTSNNNNKEAQTKTPGHRWALKSNQQTFVQTNISS